MERQRDGETGRTFTNKSIFTTSLLHPLSPSLLHTLTPSQKLPLWISLGIVHILVMVAPDYLFDDFFIERLGNYSIEFRIIYKAYLLFCQMSKPHHRLPGYSLQEGHRQNQYFHFCKSLMIHSRQDYLLLLYLDS